MKVTIELMDISLDYLHECFKYEPDTGFLVWRHRPVSHFQNEHRWKIWITRFAGKNAGCVGVFSNTCHYITVRINGKQQLAHRVIFYMVHGWLPEAIDHIDQNGMNNRIDNLRAATHATNALNTRMRSDNTSGFQGVSWSKFASKWRAQFQIAGKTHHIGYYDTTEAANAAYRETIEAAGFSSNHGSFLQQRG